MQFSIKKQLNKSGLGISIILFGLIVIFSIGNANFFTVSNFMTIIRQITYLTIITIGMSFVLISGGIDLSVGAQMAFVGVVTAKIIAATGGPQVLICVLGVLIATAVGTLNGLFISRSGVPPLIATLATQQVLRGFAYIISGGVATYGLNESVSFIGQGYIWGIPTPVIIMVISILFGVFMLNKTYIGRSFYIIGSNEEVGRLSGIKTKRVKTIAYTLCGMASGVGAIIMMSRINSGTPTVGVGYEMDVLTAAVLGGVSVNGGEGKLFGAVVGALIIGVLSNGLTIMNVSEYYQMVIKGVVLASAVAFDSLKNRRMVPKTS